MNIYVAYKFSNIENKQGVREDVQNVAALLERAGHNTFILGRDLQKWKNYSHPVHHKMFTIFNQIRKSDCVVAYVNAHVFSRGLFMEMLMAKMLGKKIVLAIRNDVKESFFEKISDEVVRYNSFNDLIENLECTQD